MNYSEKIIGDIEEHSVEGIIECFENGVDPNGSFNGEPLIFELTSEYARTPRFSKCVLAFVDHGLVFEDKVLLAVLLNNADSLASYIREDASIVNKKYALRCAYTPLEGVTLLHVCAEFNHLICAKILVANGADINARAGTDEYGFGGQTPIFHTVNQNGHNSKDMFDFLMSFPVDLQLTVKGLTWGKGYPWETLIPAVNPISYAMMGSLPQMHRREQTVSQVVARLLKTAYDIEYDPPNVPNKYLSS